MTETTPLAELRQATHIGQLVAGTSVSSRYVCVLLTPKMNMAVRTKATTLSVRVEPVPAAVFTQGQMLALAELGFTVQPSGNYASMHLVVHDEKALVTVASLVMGVSLLIGKGETDKVVYPDFKSLLMLPGEGV